jgi:heat shock protein HslJ
MPRGRAAWTPTAEGVDVDSAPGNDTAETPPAAARLDGPTWRLTHHAGPAGDLASVPDGVVATATFADGQVSGSTGCNRYHGAYEVTGDRIALTGLAMTMMACGPAETAVERAFTAALESAATYAVHDDTLELAGSDGRVSLLFRVAQPPDLVGTRWLATMINNGRGGVVSLLEETEIDAIFGADGQVAGSGGCNRYSGAYTLDGADLSIGPLASTMKMCVAPDGVGEQEASYFAALARVTTRSFQDDRLQLRAADDALQVEYRSAPSG